MIEEVKDRSFVQHIVEVAGQERMATERRKALAGVIYARAIKLDLSPQPDLVDILANYADEEQLMAIIDGVDKMTDVIEFIRSHGVSMPGYDS